MGEVASTIAQGMIESLLNVHALTNMHRSSDVEEYRKSAAGWLPTLERQLASLRYELTKAANPGDSANG